MTSGELLVTMDVQSNFLSNNLPYVVRDANLAVVQRGTCGTSAKLPEGLYSVAVLTADGRRAEQLVQVKGNEKTTVSFADITYPSTLDLSATAGATSSGDDPLPSVGPATLLSMTGCTTSFADAYGWEFVPQVPLTAVPWAEFLLEGRVVQMSLPLNPTGTYPLNSCRVNVDTTGDRPELRMAFAPDRLVTRLVDGLVRNSSETIGRDLLDEATSLLYSKYADPAGAALGGLTLHRMGMLTQRRDWAENLVHDAPWLVDGQVLLAALLRDEDPGERKRGLELLLIAAQHRPMYTDALALAMDLLRRWPDTARQDERTKALGRFADLSAYADGSSVSLCVQPNQKEPS